MMAWRGQNRVGRSFDFGMLSRVTTLATQSITSGVQTSAMITGMAAAAGLQGMRQGMAGGRCTAVTAFQPETPAKRHGLATVRLLNQEIIQKATEAVH